MQTEISTTELIETINVLTSDLKALKEKNKELADQLQQSKVSLIGEWSINLKNREVYWSDGMYELLNLEKDVAPDMKIFYKKLPRECSDQLNGAIQSVFLTRNNYSFEHFIIFDKSKALNVKTDLSLITDTESKPLKIVGKTSDITSVKSAQQELERLSLIASKTSNAIVILDISGNIDWINTGFTMMTGYRIEEIKKAPFKEYLYSNKSKFSDPHYLTQQLSEQHSINEELRLKTKMNKELWVLINISPILNYELNPVNYILIMSDITQQRKIEEELRQTEKMVALGKLSSGLAHELNNPASACTRAASQLQGVIGDLQKVTVELAKINADSKHWNTISDWFKLFLAKKEQTELLSPLELSDEEEKLNDWFNKKGIEQGWQLSPIFVQQGTWVADLEKIASWYPPELIEPVFILFCKSLEVSNISEAIEKGTGSISNLVNVVKSYSFMDQAAVQYVDIHDGIDDTLKILAHNITPEIEIVRQFQNDLPKIEIFGSELNQVWTNLLENAIFAVRGAGKITIRTFSYNDKLKVEIEDSGIGIPKEIWDRIFDPFFTTKEVGEGTGLGLDVVRRIVINRIGGEIDFVSKPGQTIFKVLLPVKKGK